MDKSKREQVKNPRESAGVLSALTFKWLLPTFILGYRRDLQESDLTSPVSEHKSKLLGHFVERAWEREEKRCKKRKDDSRPSLIRVLTDCFGKEIVLQGAIQTTMEFGTKVAEPIILASLLHSLRASKEERGNDTYYYAAGLIACFLYDAVIFHSTSHNLMITAMKIRVAICTLIYRKVLRLSNSIVGSGTSAGQLINFLSIDVMRVEAGVFYLHYVWLGPIQALIVGYLAFQEIGWPAVVGVLVFLIFVPIQAGLGKKVSHLALISTQKTDYRLRLMNEVIGGLQIIKMYVWERPFSLLVEKARRKEVNAIKKYLMLEEMTLTVDGYVPRVALFLAIILYVMDGNYINAETVFMISAFYSILQRSMSQGFPLSVVLAFEGLMSLKRIREFMSSPTKLTKHAPVTSKSDQLQPPSIILKNVSAKWDSDSKENTLNDHTFSVHPGTLFAVIGQVGSGKSSLLQAILHELPVSSGDLQVQGRIAYASQQPWIFASSVKQNILFGREMDYARYDRVIGVCQLKADLASFAHGDKTIVGEKGISLSGGQRARINLARAIYAEADIYLLDDPLSAVDIHVGRKIVEECIRDYLREKVVVLVTHQLQYLKSSDEVILMSNGNIEKKGNLDEVRTSGGAFTKLLKSMSEAEEDEKVARKNSVRGSAERVGGDKKDADKDDPLEVAEMRTTGRVSFGVYVEYFKACGSAIFVCVMFLLFIVNRALQSGSDYFLSSWVSTEEVSLTESANGTAVFVWQGALSRNSVIYLYSGLVLIIVSLCIVEIVVYFVVCMRSSKNLHKNMFRSIVRTTMYFFNVNPMGRILNRFSKDMAMVDGKLPHSMYDVLAIFLIVCMVIILIGVINPLLLVPISITGCLFYWFRLIYISTSRSVKRLEGITRSPVFDHVGATTQGLPTIRAFKAERILASEFDTHQDVHTSAWYLFICASRAFGIYLELCCVLCVAIIFLIFLTLNDSLVVADVGLVITQTVALTMMLQWGLRQSAEMENHMTSVERVLEYSRLKEEPSLDSKPDRKPPDDWPMNGCVEFRRVKLRYSDDGEYVLKGVDFTALPKEKIGIVGRTGAGKTSLISALFRLAHVEGDIRIDGISTGDIGLHDFRSRISIIPQEPILFAGSLRRNLDPFDEYSDALLWQALQEVKLKKTISEMAAGLSTSVSEGGVNFSVGQRQLLCLARAIVRENNIMVLDEATANVDPQTDSLIQQTVRKKFKDCTVLTVAHRLNTVMDSDKILVMDSGYLVEFDHPHVLLQRKGHFYSMVEQTGPVTAASLTEIARKCFDERKSGTTPR